MADRLNSGKIWRVLAAGCVLATPAFAQSLLPDPTRPPAGFVQEGDLSVPVFSGPVLESVIIPKKGKPLAVISGRPVRLGESYGESRLIRLSEREAVLEGPAGIERLPLTPGIEKINVITKNKARASTAPSRGSNP